MAQTPIQLIAEDHRRIEDLFEKFDNSDGRRRDAIATMIFDELDAHAIMEEEVFYPSLKAEEDSEISNIVSESYEEHAKVKQIILQLREMNPAENEFSDGMEELKRNVEHHVHEEESRMLPYAEEKLSDDEMEEVAEDMKQLKVKMR
ncbi:hypothetical protein A3B18_03100 [Candidatus Giovannonibacteria bacterium RIFCSPLOWO2_01_FULL_46_13]|uniref:POU-specific domain-containing protein n=1 Tax=Candidatus Giovannonibacteria bacterium RIFCSPLOWO2_01_FULL_46_13 TaxID=1798352 RepID=A0A1F5X331_9BACT|nr:MAG: hypothetical protein A3B18_03100 [Candidatus Giovannonibacteria bacterium RIFCSPLOWO2_01_FULL_46_13]